MCPNRKPNRQAGFSMMELMISMTIMTIVTGCAFALIGGSIKFTNATFHMTDAEQTLRTAHEIINRDLTTAGNGLKGVGNIWVPSAFVANYLTLTPDAADPNYVNLALVVSDDNIPANTAVPQSNPAATVLGGSDRMTMLTQDTSFNNGNAVSLFAGQITVAGSNTNIAVGAANIGLFQAGEIYAVTTQNGMAFGVITSINAGTNTLVMANGDVYGLNQTIAHRAHLYGCRPGCRPQHGCLNHPDADNPLLREREQPAGPACVRSQGRRLRGQHNRGACG